MTIRVVLAIFSLLAAIQPHMLSAGEQNRVPLTILHWNDWHAENQSRWRHIDGDSLLIGGSAVLGGYLNHYRETTPNLLVFHAGDDFQGTPISSLSRGASQVALLNLLQPDAFAVGNHEFDYTADRLLEVMMESSFPVLLANVVREEDGSYLFPSDTILFAGGIRVGVTGVISQELRGMTTHAATRGLRVLPPAEAIRISLERLSATTHIQVVISHCGLEADSLIAEEVGSEIELIVGGHSHTLLREARWVNGVPIVQAGSHGRWLGVVEMVVDTLEGVLSGMTARVDTLLAGVYPEDDTVASLVAEQEAEIAPEMDRVIAEIATPLRRQRSGESNIGNWITDAYRAAVKSDIAAINQYGIRADIEYGPLTIRSIHEVSPFGNFLVSFNLSGRELKEVVSHQAKSGGPKLLFSGMSYHFAGGEIVALSVGGQPVDLSRMYSIATINYVTDHFEAYFGLDRARHPLTAHDLIDRDVLIDHAVGRGVLRYEIEGRIRVE